MLVIDEATMKKIGRVNVSNRVYRDGDKITLMNLRYDHATNYKTGVLETVSEHFVLPVMRLKRSVKISDFALANERVGGVSTESIVRHRADELMTIIMEEEDMVMRTYKDFENMGTVVEASVLASVIDETTAEQLFDMDQFTPA